MQFYLLYILLACYTVYAYAFYLHTIKNVRDIGQNWPGGEIWFIEKSLSRILTQILSTLGEICLTFLEKCVNNALFFVDLTL